MNEDRVRRLKSPQKTRKVGRPKRSGHHQSKMNKENPSRRSRFRHKSTSPKKPLYCVVRYDQDGILERKACEARKFGDRDMCRYKGAGPQIGCLVVFTGGRDECNAYIAENFEEYSDDSTDERDNIEPDENVSQDDSHDDACNPISNEEDLMATEVAGQGGSSNQSNDKFEEESISKKVVLNIGAADASQEVADKGIDELRTPSSSDFEEVETKVDEVNGADKDGEGDAPMDTDELTSPEAIETEKNAANFDEEDAQLADANQEVADKGIDELRTPSSSDSEEVETKVDEVNGAEKAEAFPGSNELTSPEAIETDKKAADFDEGDAQLADANQEVADKGIDELRTPSSSDSEEVETKVDEVNGAEKAEAFPGSNELTSPEAIETDKKAADFDEGDAQLADANQEVADKGIDELRTPSSSDSEEVETKVDEVNGAENAEAFPGSNESHILNPAPCPSNVRKVTYFTVECENEVSDAQGAGETAIAIDYDGGRVNAVLGLNVPVESEDHSNKDSYRIGPLMFSIDKTPANSTTNLDEFFVHRLFMISTCGPNKLQVSTRAKALEKLIMMGVNVNDLIPGEFECLDLCAYGMSVSILPIDSHGIFSTLRKVMEDVQLIYEKAIDMRCQAEGDTAEETKEASEAEGNHEAPLFFSTELFHEGDELFVQEVDMQTSIENQMDVDQTATYGGTEYEEDVGDDQASFLAGEDIMEMLSNPSNEIALEPSHTSVTQILQEIVPEGLLENACTIDKRQDDKQRLSTSSQKVETSIEKSGKARATKGQDVGMDKDADENGVQRESVRDQDKSGRKPRRMRSRSSRKESDRSRSRSSSSRRAPKRKRVEKRDSSRKLEMSDRRARHRSRSSNSVSDRRRRSRRRSKSPREDSDQSRKSRRRIKSSREDSDRSRKSRRRSTSSSKDSEQSGRSRRSTSSSSSKDSDESGRSSRRSTSSSKDYDQSRKSRRRRSKSLKSVTDRRRRSRSASYRGLKRKRRESSREQGRSGRERKRSKSRQHDKKGWTKRKSKNALSPRDELERLKRRQRELLRQLKNRDDEADYSLDSDDNDSSLVLMDKITKLKDESAKDFKNRCKREKRAYLQSSDCKKKLKKLIKERSYPPELVDHLLNKKEDIYSYRGPVVIMDTTLAAYRGESSSASGFCLFCKKIYNKVSLHLKSRHRKEDRMIELLQDDMHDEGLELIRLEGNYVANNCRVIATQTGVFIPIRRSKHVRCYTSMVSCQFCHGGLHRSHLSDHLKVCKFAFTTQKNNELVEEAEEEVANLAPAKKLSMQEYLDHKIIGPMAKEERRTFCLEDPAINSYLLSCSYNKPRSPQLVRNVRGYGNLLARYFLPLMKQNNWKTVEEAMKMENKDKLRDHLLSIGKIDTFYEDSDSYIADLQNEATGRASGQYCRTLSPMLKCIAKIVRKLVCDKYTFNSVEYKNRDSLVNAMDDGPQWDKVMQSALALQRTMRTLYVDPESGIASRESMDQVVGHVRSLIRGYGIALEGIQEMTLSEKNRLYCNLVDAIQVVLLNWSGNRDMEVASITKINYDNAVVKEPVHGGDENCAAMAILTKDVLVLGKNNAIVPVNVPVFLWSAVDAVISLHSDLGMEGSNYVFAKTGGKEGFRSSRHYLTLQLKVLSLADGGVGKYGSQGVRRNLVTDVVSMKGTAEQKHFLNKRLGHSNNVSQLHYQRKDQRISKETGGAAIAARYFYKDTEGKSVSELDVAGRIRDEPDMLRGGETRRPSANEQRPGDKNAKKSPLNSQTISASTSRSANEKASTSRSTNDKASTSRSANEKASTSRSTNDKASTSRSANEKASTSRSTNDNKHSKPRSCQTAKRVEDDSDSEYSSLSTPASSPQKQKTKRKPSARGRLPAVQSQAPLFTPDVVLRTPGLVQGRGRATADPSLIAGNAPRGGRRGRGRGRGLSLSHKK